MESKYKDKVYNLLADLNSIFSDPIGRGPNAKKVEFKIEEWPEDPLIIKEYWNGADVEVIHAGIFVYIDDVNDHVLIRRKAEVYPKITELQYDKFYEQVYNSLLVEIMLREDSTGKPDKSKSYTKFKSMKTLYYGV